MAGFKALFVGEQKVKKTYWKSREDAARTILRDGLSVSVVYETEDGNKFFDRSYEIALLLHAMGQLPDNVRKFVERHVCVRQG